MQDAMLFSYWLQLFHGIHFSFDPFVWFSLTGFLLLGSYYYLYRSDKRFQKTFVSFLVYFVLQFLFMCFSLRYYYTSSTNAFALILSLASVLPIYFYLKESDKEQNRSVSRRLIVLSYLVVRLFSTVLLFVLIFSAVYWILFWKYNHEQAKLFPNSGKKVSYLWMYSLAGLFFLMGALCYILPMEQYESVAQDPTVTYKSFPSLLEESPSTEIAFTDRAVLFQTSPRDIAVVTRIFPKETSLFHRDMEFNAQANWMWERTSIQGYFLQDNQWYRSKSFALVRNPNVAPSISELLTHAEPPEEVVLLPPPRKVSQYVIVTTYHSVSEDANSLGESIRYRSLLFPYEYHYGRSYSFYHSFLLKHWKSYSTQK